MTKLHVERMGVSGVPILLLHGWNRNGTDLRSLGECLAPFSQVHLVDLPGFGESAMPDSIWNSFQFAERLVAYLDEQEIDQVDLLGHSFGGKVAFSLAVRHPERVRKLVLMASGGLKRNRPFKERCRFEGIRFLSKCVKFVDTCFKTQLHKNKFSSRFGSPDYINAGAMRPVLVKSVNEDLTDHLNRIKAPTLLLWGEKDQETPPEVALRFHRAIPQSKLLLFPGKGHYVHNDCGAHLCASYIVPFLQQR